MNCREARKRWHERLDRARVDPMLDAHLETCGDCRAYAARMAGMVDVLGELRRASETLDDSFIAGGSELHAADGRTRDRRWPVLLRVAAMVVAVVGVGLLYQALRVTKVPPVVEVKVAQTRVDEAIVATEKKALRLGISLHEASEGRFMVVAKATGQPDVQMYWLYPTVGPGGGDNGS